MKKETDLIFASTYLNGEGGREGEERTPGDVEGSAPTWCWSKK